MTRTKVGPTRVGLLCLAATISALACRRQTSPELPPPAGVLLDPQLVIVDRAAPLTIFDGSRGSIHLGEGWSGFDSEDAGGYFAEPYHFAWITRDGAHLEVERPPASEVDFYAECRPHPDEKAAPLELSLELGGRPLGRHLMEDHWQSIRLELPSDALSVDVLPFELRARRQKTTPEIDVAEDEGLFRAACRRVTLVPRQVEDPVAFADATRIDAASGRLRIARGAMVALPLPAASAVTLNLAAMAALPWGKCRLRVELGAAVGAEAALWEGGADEAAATGQLSFKTPGRGLGRLHFSINTCGNGDFDDNAAIQVPIDDRILELDRFSRDRARPHVFVYLVDTLRADALSVYEAKRPTSPRLEEFSRDAVTYTNVHSASAWTLTSVVSLMTGVYPDRHRVYIGEKLTEEGFPTLAGRLRSLGYATVGVSQSFIAGPKFGLDVGFDDFFLSDQLNGRRLFSQRLRGRLLSWLTHDWDGERPIFAYLHSVDPHAPYLPPEYDMKLAREFPQNLPEEDYRPVRFLNRGFAADSAEVAHLRGRYDGEVAYADRELGRFLDMLRHLGLYDDSVIVFLSDHGEEFGEHGSFGHGRTMYEEMLRVPLMIKLPGSRGGGTRIDDLANVVDVLPTLLRVAGGRIEEGLDGMPLRPVRPEATPPPRRFDYSEVLTVANQHQAAVHYRAFRLDGVKCVQSVFGNDQFDRAERRWRAFDLDKDPGEKRGLRAGEPRLVRCRKTLARWLAARRRQRFSEPSSLETVDAAALERLRAVGYIE